GLFVVHTNHGSSTRVAPGRPGGRHCSQRRRARQMSDVTADAVTASRTRGVAVDGRQIPPPGRTRGSARQSAMLSSSRAGEVNRARVLKTLYANGPLARPELARLTGSTRATIGQIVQPFLDEGLPEEQDPLTSGARGGERARPAVFARA